MQQYYDIKNTYPDAILFFRMGDFYEMFGEDANTAGRELGLTVTSRNKNSEDPIPLAGIPYHAAEKYIPILTEKGYSIAICEQVSDPSGKGIVKREVVEVITPGTATRDSTLKEKHHNFLASIAQAGMQTSVAFIDISTGYIEIIIEENIEDALEEILKRESREVLLPEDSMDADIVSQTLEEQARIHISPKLSNIETVIVECFHKTLEQLSLQEGGILNYALAQGIAYIKEVQLRDIGHLRPPLVVDHSHMILPMRTLRHLEIFQTMRKQQRDTSLLGIIDHTTTSAGGRLLKTMLLKPLQNIAQIEDRYDLVELLFDQGSLRNELRAYLGHTYDIERILSRLCLGRGNARDLIAIGKSLEQVIAMIPLLSGLEEATLGQRIISSLCQDELEQIHHLISESIAEDPPIEIQAGGIIKTGYDEDIDNLRELSTDVKSTMLRLQEKEKEHTGISNLKIKHNNVFGYFIEITKTNKDLVPEHYIRKQTLVNAERYITPELKELEERVLSAEQQLVTKEYELFCTIRDKVIAYTDNLFTIAQALASLDVYISFAHHSVEHDYVRPSLNTNKMTTIVKGRHPVVEILEKQRGGQFVPNDTTFSKTSTQHLITGPNMGGKSTYLRQTALISLLAQIGCYVPATSAQLHVYDRILSRVGAEDNLSGGQSTFMVEMSETSAILSSTTENSLLILDEIGRGTSTFDGLSIAQAIFEYIHNTNGAHTLFATHYHELIDVAECLETATNYCVGVGQQGQTITFLHSIIPGGAEDSYGIDVAKLAGLPEEVVERARIILTTLENADHMQARPQPSLFEIGNTHSVSEEITKELRQVDLNGTTPMEALQLLAELHHRAKSSDK